MDTRRDGSVRRETNAALRLDRPIVVIDLETTGTAVETDRIVEVGILKILPSGRTICRRVRINPEIRIPKEASEIHGITNADVAGKPRFQEIARRVLEFVRGCDMAGFNLKSFDLPMLRAEFKRARLDFSWENRHVVDVMEIYHFHESRTLCDAVKFYCDSAHEEAHSALEDAHATWQVLQAQIAKYGLPSSVKTLSEFMDTQLSNGFLDSGRWFANRDDAVVFAKGKKHKGEPLSRVVREDREYVNWVLSLSDLPTDTKRLIEGKLKTGSRE